MSAMTPCTSLCPLGSALTDGAANAAHTHLSSSLLAEISFSNCEKRAVAAEQGSQESLFACRKSFGGHDLRYWSYAYNKIFKRIGATSFSFQADPSGTLLGGSSVYMTPRDWARFGQLYLQVRLPIA
jgi:hypothetical protein